MNDKITPDKKDLSSARKELDQNQYWILIDVNANLVYSACTEITGISEREISKKINMPLSEVKKVAAKLFRTGFLEYNAEKKLVVREGKLKSADGIPSEIIRQHHVMSLDLAKKSIANDPVPERDFSSLSFSVDPSKMKEIRNEIRGFYERMENLFGTAENAQMHRICVQVFPVKFHPFSNEDSK